MDLLNDSNGFVSPICRFYYVKASFLPGKTGDSARRKHSRRPLKHPLLTNRANRPGVCRPHLFALPAENWCSCCAPDVGQLFHHDLLSVPYIQSALVGLAVDAAPVEREERTVGRGVGADVVDARGKGDGVRDVVASVPVHSIPVVGVPPFFPCIDNLLFGQYVLLSTEERCRCVEGAVCGHGQTGYQCVQGVALGWLLLAFQADYFRCV